MVKLAGARPVELELRSEDGWAPREEELERAISARTRVVLIGSPSNPTGAVWSEQAIRGIARVLTRHPEIIVLSDDIHDKLVYGGANALNLLTPPPALATRTILVNRRSNAY